jgi:hypothetical protein
MKKVLASFGLVAASIALVACGGGTGGANSDNPALGMNSAMVTYSQALGDYLATPPDASSGQDFMETNRVKLQRLRDSFNQVVAEASGVEFPSVAGEKGQPAQSTIDEFLSATDAYVTLEEELLRQIDFCISGGSTTVDCVTQVGTSAMVGIYPEVMKRAQSAALQLRQEASVSP